MQEIGTFEHPLNERFRLLLRIEQLFERIEHHLRPDGIWDSHAALQAVLELQHTVSRGDSKRELIKELDRQRSALERFDERPTVDRDRLSAVVAEHERLVEALHSGTGSLGDELRDNDLLLQLQQRSTAAGRPGMVELPSYQEWLQRPARERHATVREWLEPMAPAANAVRGILELVRDAGEWQDVEATGGFYERMIHHHRPIQLLRVRLPGAGDRGLFPEVSAGRQRFTIRFFRQHSPAERSSPVEGDVAFRLAACGL